jgi:hypothetical protein
LEIVVEEGLAGLVNAIPGATIQAAVFQHVNNTRLFGILLLILFGIRHSSGVRARRGRHVADQASMMK